MDSSKLPTQRRDDNDVWVHIGILSGPNNNGRRKTVRTKCLKKYEKLFKENKLTYEFVIGRPNTRVIGSHTQGHVDRQEAASAKRLWEEQQKYRDIAFIPSRDAYVDLPTKTLEIIKRGVLRGAKYVVKMDDDKCLDPDHFRELIQRANDPEYGYYAIYSWDTKGYESQLGADHKFVKYMSGPLYALTFALARTITFDDMNYAALYPMYGSASEDVDMGRWVDHVMHKHNVTVKYVTGRMTR